MTENTPIGPSKPLSKSQKRRLRRKRAAEKRKIHATSPNVVDFPSPAAQKAPEERLFVPDDFLKGPEGAFECTKCGACCRFVGGLPEDAPERQDLDRGDGVCKFLTSDNLCSIYDERPDLCRLDRFPVPVPARMQAESCCFLANLVAAFGPSPLTKEPVLKRTATQFNTPLAKKVVANAEALAETEE